IVAVMVGLFMRTPTGFLPGEGQGILFTMLQGPTGTTAEQTLDVVKQIEDYFLIHETETVESVFGVVGVGFGGQGQNMGLAFIRLKDWKEREDPSLSVQALAGRAFGAFSQIK